MHAQTAEVMADLRGTKCRCGGPKTAKRSLCETCFFWLPENLQKGLYVELAEGYVEHFLAAKKWLEENGR